MKKLLSLLFVLGLILSACGTSQTQSAPPAQTSTASLIPTRTQTPIPPTATVTPLPTIPTFTPTFDVSTIVTVTPAENAECPKENIALKPEFVTGKESYRQILNFLNEGVTKQAIITSYRQQFTWADKSIIQETDITSDGVAELLFTDYDLFSVFMCKDRQYDVAILLGETYHRTKPVIITTEDMNIDGIKEILVIEGDDRIRIVSVFEWDGKDFQQLNSIDQSCSELYGASWAETSDTDNNGTLELILKQEIPIWSEYSMGLPWRKENRTCNWDGKQFVLDKVERSSPEYRFQAIQDADNATILNQYEQALNLYQQSIFNQTLGWWSLDRKIYETSLATNQISTNIPTPQPDPVEYPRLAAYAYYRIMLLHLVQGQEAQAASAYQTLQETFGNDPYAAPYVEMASAFWDEYQSTQKMYDGCAAAIQYAVEHPEILVPLGSDYHGWQSHIYEPADVCPFR